MMSISFLKNTYCHFDLFIRCNLMLIQKNIHCLCIILNINMKSNRFVGNNYIFLLTVRNHSTFCIGK